MVGVVPARSIWTSRFGGVYKHLQEGEIDSVGSSDCRGAEAISEKTRSGPCYVMNVNFFEWLRDGVRQSVLLGVSDAIEQIGTPADSDDLHPNVAAMLQGDGSKPKKTRNAGGRKRLGKSLKEMDAAPAKS